MATSQGSALIRWARWGFCVGLALYAIAWLIVPIPQARAIVSVTEQIGAAGFLGAAFSGAVWCVLKLIEGKRPTFTGIKLGVFATIFVMFFPFALVAIVTSGGVIVPHGHSSSWQLWLANALTTQLCWLILLLIAAWPQILRKRAPWDMAADQTKRMLPGWAATLAAGATGGAVLLMHLRGAPLAATSAGKVVIAALVASALLAPLYLMLFKLVWRMGLPEVLSPLRWMRVLRDTRGDLVLLHAISHFHERHGKGESFAACPECQATLAEARRRILAGATVCLMCVMEEGLPRRGRQRGRALPNWPSKSARNWSESRTIRTSTARPGGLRAARRRPLPDKGSERRASGPAMSDGIGSGAGLSDIDHVPASMADNGPPGLSDLPVPAIRQASNV